MKEISPQDTKVLIICGGLSYEREISISSGHRVGEFLRKKSWNVEYHDMDNSLIHYLLSPQTKPHLVWPLLHGSNGEDGSIRDILEMCQLIYVGSRAKAARTAWNKPIAKNILRKLGNFHTPHSITLPKSVVRELGVQSVINLLNSSFTFPIFIKPARGGSALGCTFVKNKEDISRALILCFAYDDTALIEQAIIGTEVSVSVIDINGELHALPPLEISNPHNIYDFEKRYTPGASQFFVPARLDSTKLEELQTLAIKAHTLLGLRDFSRTDFIVDTEGVPQFLETNVTPGMTDTSMLPLAAEVAGYNLEDLYSTITSYALQSNRIKNFSH